MRISAESGDLAVHALVVIGGVRAWGRTTGITLEKDFRALVDMNLEQSLKISTDTSASIVTAGMLGDQWSIRTAAGGRGPELEVGDKIMYTGRR